MTFRNINCTIGVLERDGWLKEFVSLRFLHLASVAVAMFSLLERYPAYEFLCVSEGERRRKLSNALDTMNVSDL